MLLQLNLMSRLTNERARDVVKYLTRDTLFVEDVSKSIAKSF